MLRKRESMVVYHAQVEQRKKFALRRMGWLGGIIGVLTVIIALWVYLDPLQVFVLRQIRISGNHRIESNTLKNAIGLSYGTGLFTFDPLIVKSRIQKVMWVKSAKVYRSLPDILTVEIEEYQPAAILLRDKPYLMSTEGHLLPPAPRGYILNLPVITEYPGKLPGVGAKSDDHKLLEVVAILREMKQFRLYSRVSEVRFSDAFRYRLLLDDGRIELLLGRQRRESISAVENFLNKLPSTTNLSEIAYIDARSPGFIAVNDRPLETPVMS